MATTSLSGLQAFAADIGLQQVPSFAEADVLNNPLDIYHAYLAEHLKTLVECDPHLVYNSIHPSNGIENGDLDIVLPQLKLPSVSPKELAGELLKKPHPLFAAPFKDGIHIRFFFSTKTLPRLLLPYINGRKEKYGVYAPLNLQNGTYSVPKKVIVDFSSPNIARDFTAAHLRSTILGAFVANLHSSMGYSVVKINYLGDWGKNLGLLGVGWQKYGSDEALAEQEDLFRYIHDLYAKMEKELQPEQDARKKARDDGKDTSILESQGLFAERDATFKRMEDGDPDAIALWEKLRAISVDYYSKNFARFNLKFDEFSGESKVSLNPDTVAEVESALKEKGIYEEDSGAWVIDFDKHGAKLGKAALRDRNGSTTYLLRDIATVFDRLKTHAFDKMVYVVCEQDVHFRQVFKAVELMGHPNVANKLQHITFPKPNTIVSPTGNALLLSDILDQCENSMHEVITASPPQYQLEHCAGASKLMGINSLLLQELAARKGHSSGLDFNLLTLADGDTGTSLQLCYARLCAAIAGIRTQPSQEDVAHLDYSPLSEPPWSDLLRLLARYPEAIHAAFKILDPAPILTYLFRVVEELTACLDEAAEDEDEASGSAPSSVPAARAVLYEQVRQVLENGLKLLGAIPISRK
ncbi:Arginyl-tRNA synthetase [Hyphodiscus hymeniophilus]|uniref:arginine--tRNA ligase n=1 Tax=Hyphodiscus hymeniophilus TaxID=353542 RepID=A0A9P6VDN4_9HELO|nr:Arginyl-tRNA synthetase [Hyphodiscus hymeniophilus]